MALRLAQRRASLRMLDKQWWAPGENFYFDFTSMVPEEAGCSAVAGWPDMG